jgi:hypothetical protein
MRTRRTEDTGVHGGLRTEEGVPYSSVFAVLIPNHMLATHAHDIPQFSALHTPVLPYLHNVTLLLSLICSPRFSDTANAN